MNFMSAKKRRYIRGASTRRRQQSLEMCRIVARISGRHIYAQIISVDNKVLAAVGTPQIRESLNNKCSTIAAAESVGRLLAEKAAQLDLGKLAFDRGGRKYHGKVKALAESLRASGLKF